MIIKTNFKKTLPIFLIVAIALILILSNFNKTHNNNWHYFVPIIFIVVILFGRIMYNSNVVKENFVFTPWNMGTRFYPSYDIRGYPQLYPWNYPYPGLPYLYWSPFFYEANGKYTIDPKYAKILNIKK